MNRGFYGYFSIEESTQRQNIWQRPCFYFSRKLMDTADARDLRPGIMLIMIC